MRTLSGSRLWTITILASAVATAAAAEPANRSARPAKWWIFVGTYTDGASRGIYRLTMDPATGKLSEPELAAQTPNPSFLAVHPTRKWLYAVGETGGPQGGTVAAFTLDTASGTLKFLNRQPAGGSGPCHLTVDAAGKNVLVANYGSGTAAVLPLEADGRLREPACVIQHRASGAQRPTEPHAHSINLDRDIRFAFVADLGLDRVFAYRFDPQRSLITANDPPAVALPPRSGPRHFAFHPDGKHAYVINEIANTVTVFDYDSQHGVLTPVQTISTLPKEFRGQSWTAEVQVHPSGKFLYGSNRGHNSIAVFAIDTATGKLTAAGHQTKGIKIPRNFGIDPTGAFLVVANQDGDDLVVFRVDSTTGALEPTGITARVPRPVCVKFVPVQP